MSARHVDRAIEALARSRHGVYSRRQALLTGGTASIVDRRVKSGTWLRLASSIHALAGNPATWHRQVKAAELSVPGSAVCRVICTGLPRCPVGERAVSRPW